MRLTLHNSIRTWVFVTPVSTLIPPVPTLEHLQMPWCPAPAVAMAFWRSSAHTVPKTPESSAPLKRNISALRTQMVHMHLTEIISTTTRCKPSCLWRDGSSATSWCGLHPIFSYRGFCLMQTFLQKQCRMSRPSIGQPFYLSYWPRHIHAQIDCCQTKHSPQTHKNWSSRDNYMLYPYYFSFWSVVNNKVFMKNN